MHTENQLHILPGSDLKVCVVGGGGGGFHCIMWSPQLRFVLELGCDNYQMLMNLYGKGLKIWTSFWLIRNFPYNHMI